MGTRRWVATGLVTAGAVLAAWGAWNHDGARAPGRQGKMVRGPTAKPSRGAGPGHVERAPRVATRPPEGEVIVRAAWGAEVGALGRKSPSEGAPEAPMSFAIDGRGRVHVLDQLNTRIEIFEPGHEPRVVALPSDTFQDIDVDARGRVVAVDRLATQTVAFLDDSGQLDHTVPLDGPGVPEGGAVTALFTREDGTWIEVEHKELVRIADASGEPDPDRPAVAGRFSADGSSLLRAGIEGPSSVRVTSQPASGHGAAMTASLAFPMSVLAVHALESDRQGRIYLAVNLIRESEQAPFDVTDERETVVVLAKDGRELGRVDIAPPQGPEEQFRPIRVGDDGQIYQLVCNETGATIERFSL